MLILIFRALPKHKTDSVLAKIYAPQAKLKKKQAKNIHQKLISQIVQRGTLWVGRGSNP